jgi:5-methylcytosine-specific restriction endonuclease McrA
MARIRTIKPEFWADEKLAPLNPLHRLVFLGLISQADDAGRVVDSPRLINGLLFPHTEDDCTVPLADLAEIGVIDRGMTASGQAVIQIVGWAKHQRIEKPNLRGALPAVENSTTRRRKIPDHVRHAIMERDRDLCQECGVEVQKRKVDKYDSSPNLAEIDHIVAVADGGTNDIENLRLLCLSCNRKKAGADARRRNSDDSGKGRGNVGEESQKHTYDLRSTTNDQRPTTDEQLRAAAGEDVSLPDSTRTANGRQRSALDELVMYVGVEHQEFARTVSELPDVGTGWARGLMATYGPDGSMEGEGIPADQRAQVLGIALRRYATDADRWYGPRFKAFVDRVWGEICERRLAAERTKHELGDTAARKAAQEELAAADMRRLEEEGAKISAGLSADQASLIRVNVGAVSDAPRESVAERKARAQQQLAALRRGEGRVSA